MNKPEFTPDWLALREKADADARSEELLDPLRAHLAGTDPLVVRDLGCGTGAQGRWLSPKLPRDQHWILHDRDPALLARARLNPLPEPHVVTVEKREGDLTGLSADDLAGTSLVTASALLDLLTAEEVNHLASACVRSGCPALFTLSVAGRVDMTPAEPLDTELAEAFNAHQRRTVGGRRLLGPDAVDAAVEAFERHGATVLTRPSPWRLGNDALTAEWLRGWVSAACEQEPGLASEADAYTERRLGADLRVVVRHTDILALP